MCENIIFDGSAVIGYISFTFFLNCGYCLRVVVVAAGDSCDLSGLLIISHSSKQQVSQSGHKRYKRFTVCLKLQMSIFSLDRQYSLFGLVRHSTSDIAALPGLIVNVSKRS